LMVGVTAAATILEAWQVVSAVALVIVHTMCAREKILR